MLFSIITPSLNQGLWLEENLASVRNAGVEVEHIIIDGGSTDGTIGILQNQSFASWISEPDRGQTDAINKGLQRSKGEILGYLCADDYYEPLALRRVAEAFAADPSLHVVFGDGWFLEGGSGWKRRKAAGEFSYARLRRGNFLIQPAIFWRRKVFEHFGAFDPGLQFCMDHEYWLRIGPYTRWHYLPEPLATCRLHGGAKTSRALIPAWQEAATMQAGYGMIWRPRWEALWMRVGGEKYYGLKRKLFARMGKAKGERQKAESEKRKATGENSDFQLPATRDSPLHSSTFHFPPSAFKNIPRLVVFELHHLGDAVLAVPFLRAASSHFRITIFCRPPVAGLLREILPGIEILEAPASWPGRLAAVRNLKLGSRDVAVSCWADARVHLLMGLSGAGHRVGFPMTRENYYAPDLPWRQRRLQFGRVLSRVGQLLSSGPLLTRPLTRKSPTQSHLDGWKQVAGAFDLSLNLDPPWITPRTHVLPVGVQNFLDAHRDEPILVLHPGGRLPTKRWPKFQALLERLASDPPLATLILQPPGEPAPHPCHENQFLVSSSDWPTMLSVIQSATVVLCNDSLASHLAAALGRPVVTIFGSGNPDWFAPFQNADRVVATNVCPYRPCIDRCVMPSIVCLESVTVEQVESRVREAIDHTAPKICQ